MSFSVIHLSDIHIFDDNDIILSRIEKLKAACASEIPTCGNVVITISGDIAFSGKKSQYCLAKKMLEEISQYIIEERNASVDFAFVPGNHDCDFSLEKSTRKTLVSSPAVNDIDNDYYNTVSEIQKEYFEFAESFGLDGKDLFCTKDLLVENGHVLFVLANTSWMSILHENPGRIVMPPQLFPRIASDQYKAVFYVFHHPINWLNPDYKVDFVANIRQNADVVLIGHEHARDSYQQSSTNFSVLCNHGKELQDSNSEASAFSIITFDSGFQNYTLVDYVWDDNKYTCVAENKNQFHKNIACAQTVFHPNKEASESARDMGFTVTHFAKDEVLLPDLFVWPDIKRKDYHNPDRVTKTIRNNVYQEIVRNDLSFLVGMSSAGKSAIAKMLFISYEDQEISCVLAKGTDFISSDTEKIRETISELDIKQYSKNCLEDFWQLPKEKRVIIIDDFELIKHVGDRRSSVLDFAYNNFKHVIILTASAFEITSILTSNTISKFTELYYYDILPFGNRKRKEFISKWYRLNDSGSTDDQISERIDTSITKIDTFLGNGAAFIPAMPVFLIGALQNIDAITRTYNGSQYGFMYESLIMSSLSKVSSDYISSGAVNVDISIFSQLAFRVLKSGHTSFSENDLKEVVSLFCDKKMVDVSYTALLNRMIDAKIIYRDTGEGQAYRFKYPYIFYYYAGRYIAYNLTDEDVQGELEYMSSRLYNETYGNIVIFVCHFANSKEVIENILLNAYTTLDGYGLFDFSKDNPSFEGIQDAIEALIPQVIDSNEQVEENKNRKLMRMDEAGINDGCVKKGEEVIEDQLTEKEQDFAAVSSALKTIEVLGQILQNYPGDIEGHDKVNIIDEMHSLGMRTVQAMISTMGCMETDLVEYLVDRAVSKKHTISKEDIIKATKRFISMMIAGLAQGMVHQVAIALNSEFILPAATKTYEEDGSISSKLVLLDLKLNCLNKVNFHEINGLKKSFDQAGEMFASYVLDAIVARYLNYNRCDHLLREKLCNLCHLSKKNMLIDSQAQLSE